MLSTVIMLSLVVAALFALVVAYYTWWRSREGNPAARSLTFVMLLVVFWIGVYSLEVLDGLLDFKLLAHNTKFVSIALIPVVWMIFALQYTARQLKRLRQWFVLLSFMPFMTITLIYSNSLHQLVWSEINHVKASGFYVTISTTNWWFWVHAFYSYGLLLIGSYLLLRQFLVSPSIYRRQLSAIFIAIAAPFVANAITIFNNAPIDLTPFAFVITGAALAWGLFRYQLLDLLPVARSVVVDSMSDGMIVIDAQGRILDVNPAAEVFLRQAESTMLGKRMAEIVPLLAQQPELIEKYRQPQIIHDELVLEDDGQTRFVDVRVSPVRNPQGEVTGRVIIFRDITARKEDEKHIQEQNRILRQVNEELDTARQQAEQATLLKSQFLATMSHELRTPLNAIIGFTQIQLEGMAGDLTHEQRRYQERVLANSEHLLGLINDILDLSKIEAGRMDILRKPYHLREWVAEIVAQNRVLTEAKGLEFHVEIDDQLPDVMVGDAMRLKQVIINLLSNAIKFTEKGFVNLQVCTNDLETWKIMVTDSGIGVPAHAQETIFEEFRQVDGTPSRQHGGTGLGLSIVRKLTLMMGGTIRVKSEVDKGSTFTVIMPLIKEHDLIVS